ncbi:hypothetical protein AVEN_212401-1 [Araneus ventricosus]|uniref:Uncharacterized protein n=1 Tax=Araneus ventricosus TaxID=182803 RepID=A0A4Y2PX34_ARAVE|nr:hypothetical protein AVEN_212401-1 [Araneus ventricosus]
MTPCRSNNSTSSLPSSLHSCLAEAPIQCDWYMTTEYLRPNFRTTPAGRYLDHDSDLTCTRPIFKAESLEESVFESDPSGTKVGTLPLDHRRPIL